MTGVKDNYYLANLIRVNNTISLQEDILIKKPVEINKSNIMIDGNGHVIDGDKKRIFEIKGKNVILKNIIFKNAKAPNGIFTEPKGVGGAILNRGRSELINCEFINNSAKKNGNDIFNKGDLTIQNCKFSQSANGKKAILNNGSLNGFESEKDELESAIYNINTIEWWPEPVVDDAKIKITPKSSVKEVYSEISTASKPADEANQGYILNQPFDAYEGDEPFVFISYKHSDYRAVYPIIDKLHNAGIRIWYDAGLPIGRNYDIQIAKNIERSKLFVTFITEEVIRCADNEDDYLVKEASVAIHLGKEYLPIYLDKVDLAGFYVMHYLGKQSILKFDYGDNEEKFIEACISAFKDDYGIEPEINE